MKQGIYFVETHPEDDDSISHVLRSANGGQLIEIGTITEKLIDDPHSVECVFTANQYCFDITSQSTRLHGMRGENLSDLKKKIQTFFGV